MLTKKQISKIDTDLVIELVCRYLNVSEFEVYDLKHNPKLTKARFMVFFVLCRIFKMEHEAAGKIFGVTHKNVFYGCDRILNDILLYKESKQEYNDIRKLMIKNMKNIITIPEANALRM